PVPVPERVGVIDVSVQGEEEPFLGRDEEVVGVRDASGVVADDGARWARHEQGHHDHAETNDSQAPAGPSVSDPASLLHASPPILAQLAVLRRAEADTRSASAGGSTRSATSKHYTARPRSRTTSRETQAS